MPETMRAAVFKEVRDIHIEEVPVPRCGPTEAIVKITTTTIPTASISVIFTSSIEDWMNLVES